MAKIFTKIGKTNITETPYISNNGSVLDNIPPNTYDIEFENPNLITMYDSIYNQIRTNNSNNQGILQNYYKTYGYTSLIGDISSYLLGIKDASSLMQSGTSMLIPGVTKSAIGSFLLKTTNISLRNPFISNAINSILPSPFSMIEEGTIKWQYLPSQIFLSSNPQNIYISEGDSGGLIDGIIKNAAASVVTSTLSGLASSGKLTSFDFERLLGTTYNTLEILSLSSTGLKYTKAVGWYDTTRPIWASTPGYITWDKYISYAGDELSYSKAKEMYKDTMLDRYDPNKSNKIQSLPALAKESTKQLNNPPIPSSAIPSTPSAISNNILTKNADKIKLYNDAFGKSINPSENSDLVYSNRSDIRDKMNRLGFPLYNKADSINLNIKNGHLDMINMKDIIYDSAEYDYKSEEYRDLIDFRFEDISSVGKNNPIILVFRSAIKNLSDKFTPSWSEKVYIGRPDKFYTYTGFTRDISFSMNVYCNSKDEIIPQWRKINRLAGMCYPVAYSNNVSMKSPILRLTIGDLYQGIYGFINSLTINVIDESFWGIDIGYQLPMVISVDIGFTVIYEVDGLGAPITDSPHFYQRKMFPSENEEEAKSIFGKNK